MLIRIKDVMARTSLTRGTVYRLVADGKFPKPVHIAERSPRWVAAEVDRYVAERLAERDRAA